MSASSATEEKHWKTEILKSVAALAEMATPGAWDLRKYSFLNIALVPLDRIQYAAASLARRSSMDAMAISRKFHVQQVFIKKTHCPHNSEEAISQVDGEVERPKTSVSRSALAVTAKRMDRIRLERLIAEVYTRDVLPLPGMVLGRGDLFRRGSLMRRLSFHTGFDRRSSSVSTSRSGPVADSGSVDEYTASLAGSERGEDLHAGSDAGYELPKTPSSTLGRSRTLRFRSAPKKVTGPASSPRSEKRRSQDGNPELSPSRKKWGSPISLLSALSPRNLLRPRSSLGQGTEEDD